MRTARGVGVAVAAMVLAGCGSASGGTESPPAPTTHPSSLAERDGAIRPVRMTSGRALTYVLPETAAQILCQVLDRDHWARLLGGRVGRHPGGDCQIASDTATFVLRLTRSDAAFQPSSTIAGRPAAERASSANDLVISVALTDDALQPATRQYRQARQTLELQVIPGSPPDAGAHRDRALAVLNEVVPLLVKDGDAVPDIGADGNVSYVSTPVTPGGQIVDLPQPIQALELCTVLREALGVTPTTTFVTDSGRCELSTQGGTVAVNLRSTEQAKPDRIAGRPALRMSDPPIVLVRLRDDAPVDLSVSAPNSVALAEKLVPRLLA